MAVDGLRDRDDTWYEILKRVTTIVASTNIGGAKIASKINKLMPSRNSGTKTNFADKAKSIIKTVREREALKRANDKINAGRS